MRSLPVPAIVAIVEPLGMLPGVGSGPAGPYERVALYPGVSRSPPTHPDVSAGSAVVDGATVVVGAGRGEQCAAPHRYSRSRWPKPTLASTTTRMPARKTSTRINARPFVASLN